MTVEVPAENLDAWLAELKPYQRTTLEAFLENASPEEAAERWLSTTGSPNIAAFGGEKDTKPFWERFKAEFQAFMCNDEAYKEEKAELSSQGNAGKTLLISTIAASIGAAIGYAATLLVPAVVLLLFVVAKMGRNAYCAAAG